MVGDSEIIGNEILKNFKITKEEYDIEEKIIQNEITKDHRIGMTMFFFYLVLLLIITLIDETTSNPYFKNIVSGDYSKGFFAMFLFFLLLRIRFLNKYVFREKSPLKIFIFLYGKERNPVLTVLNSQMSYITTILFSFFFLMEAHLYFKFNMHSQYYPLLPGVLIFLIISLINDRLLRKYSKESLFESNN